MAGVFSTSAAYETLKPLVIFVIGMVIYSVFIFKFYRFIARKDIFKFDLSKYDGKKLGGLRKLWRVILNIFQTIFLFPIISFFAFITVLRKKFRYGTIIVAG